MSPVASLDRAEPEARRSCLLGQKDRMPTPRTGRLRWRLATAADAEAIAKLHAESWRRHYRGAYSDAFLDGDVVVDRLAVWSERLERPDARYCTILAEDGHLVGFANTIFEDDPRWGALLDNLHVADQHQRRGIGSGLLAMTGRALVEHSRRSGLYVWVLEQNLGAQAWLTGADAAAFAGIETVAQTFEVSPGEIR